MSTLDRYILSAFLRIFGLVLVSLIGVILIVDFVEHIDAFVDQGLTPTLVAIYYFYNLPSFIDMSLPMSTLLATVFTLGTLNRNYEIAALKACGISLYRITRSLLWLGVFLTVFQFLFQNFLVMPFNHKNKQMAREYLKPVRTPTVLREVIRQDLNGNIVVFSQYFPKQNRGAEVAIYSFNDSTLQQRWDYVRMNWIDSLGVWEYKNGVQRTFSAGGEVAFEKLPEVGNVPLTLTPGDIEKEEIRPDEMNIFQLAKFIEKKRILGLNPRHWITDFHFKIAFIFTGFITIFLGISFALQGSRENLAPAVGKSIFALFIYYIFIMGGKKVGNSASFHPAYAVWAGNFILLFVGSFLFWRTSKR